MVGKSFYDNKHFYIILILTLSILILGDKLSKPIFFILGCSSWVMVYLSNRKSNNIEFILIRILILSMPLSFTNIFVGTYGDSILSWFNIFLLAIIMVFIFKYLLTKNVSLNHFSIISIILILISIIPTIRSENLLSGFKQYINIIVIFILIIIGNNFKKNLSENQKNKLRVDYILSALIAGIGVLVQIIFVKGLNIVIGNYKFFGGYRHAYGFLFADYSFLSLYLVSGAMLLYSSYFKYKKVEIKWFVSIIFLLLMSILTSARTGIVAFIIIFTVYNFLVFITSIKQKSVRNVVILIANMFFVISSYILVAKTRNIAKFSDSGRSKLNKKGFELFLKKPYLGIGFGNSDLIGMFPHNIFFQYLAQGGIVYILSLTVFLVLLLWLAFKKDKEMFPVLFTVLFGALFIPNVFNSRFLPILALILSLNIEGECKYGILKSYSICKTSNKTVKS